MAWACAQRLRAAYQHPDPAHGRKIATTVVESFPTCPIPEIARLGRTLKQWRAAFLAYFDTSRSSNVGLTRLVTSPPRSCGTSMA